MIIAIIGILVMGVFLGYVFKSSSKSCYEHWDYDIKSEKLSSLETKVFILEKDNERLNYILNLHGGLVRMFRENYYAHCYKCEKTFWAKGQKDQEVADKLKSITLTSEEIAKKLGFEIK